MTGPEPGKTGLTVADRDVLPIVGSGASWPALKASTAARIGLGRAGDAIPMAAVLNFQLAHAKARDAVNTPLDQEALRIALSPRSVIAVQSLASDGPTYLRRPDLGRRLAAASRDRLDAHARLTRDDRPPDIVFVVADGLSATAVNAHAAALIAACTPQLAELTVAPIIVVKHGRVAIGDDIGALLGARVCALLVGERPGLSVSDSLGVYLTFEPRVGRLDSERNCISNIHAQGGLSYPQAADKLMWLIREALRQNLSGIKLKEALADKRILIT